MKQFIIRFVTICLPIFFIALVMEFMLRKIPNDYQVKNQYLKKYAAEIETLILGSSHAYYNLNPDYFHSNTFNASHIAQSLDYDYEIFDKYKDKLIRLKTIVLPISYFSLYGNLSQSSESWRTKNYVIYYDFTLPKSGTDYSEVLSNKFSVNIERLATYHIYKQSPISCNILGWGTKYTSEKAKDLIETGIKAAERHTYAIHGSDSTAIQTTFKENVEKINVLLAWCKANDVYVYMVTPPAYQSYRQHLDEYQLQTTVHTATSICAKYDNCTYENLLSDSIFVAKDYYDADHMSEIGAKKFSVLIDEKISNWN